MHRVWRPGEVFRPDARAAAKATTPGAAPIVERGLRGLVRVNPTATWTDQDIYGCIASHDVPIKPLFWRSYPSIGCRPPPPPPHLDREPPRLHL